MLKPVNNSRWSSRLDAIKAVYGHYGKVVPALEDLKNHDLSTPPTMNEAGSHLKNIRKHKFIMLVCFVEKDLSCQ